MNSIQLDHLSTEQKDQLGRVYQFIIARGRQNRAKSQKKQSNPALSLSQSDQN